VAVNGFGQSAKNNFSYIDGATERNMSNASLSSGVGLLQVAYKADDKNVVSLTGWYQQYYREVPRALFESQSVKNQRDESLRLLADWNRTDKSVHTSVKLSYIRDYMRYQDTLALLNTKNASNQIYAEAAMRFAVGTRHRIMIMAPISVQWVDSASISQTNTQNRYALAANYLYSNPGGKLKVALNLRGEAVDDNSYLLPGGNIAYDITSWLTLKANAQKTYRVPTLNELYHNPGGNRNLLPESGWSTDAGYVFHSNSANRVVLNHELSVFNRVIDNWIVWFGGAIWTPHNIATVHSRGVETDNKLTVGFGKLNLHLAVNTSYVLSTTVSSYISGDGSIGKQIPYAPRYNGQINIGFNFRQLYFNYNHTYTGYRFITVDESQWLMPYNTGNVQVLYTLPLGSNNLQCTAQCNNVWNKQYQVVNGRPMPGINWLLGLRFSIN
jgi:iron complex outermembrane receptor protein